MRRAALVPILLAAACGAGASDWTTGTGAVVPDGAAEAAEAPATDRRAHPPLRRRARAARPAPAAVPADEGPEVADAPGEPEDERAPPDPLPPPDPEEESAIRARVVDAAGAPVAGAHALLVLGWAALERRAGPTDEDGRIGWDRPRSFDRSNVLRVVAWTDDGRAALSPWRSADFGRGADFGDLRVVALSDLPGDEARAEARCWAELEPEPAPSPFEGGGGLAAEAPQADVASHSISGRIWFQGSPVTWERRPTSSCYSRCSGRRLGIRVVGDARDGERERLTSEDGTFTLDGLGPGPHDLWVRLSDDYSPYDDAVPADLLVRGVVAPTADLRIDLSAAVRQPLRIDLPEDLPGPPDGVAIAWEPLDGGLDGGMVVRTFGGRSGPPSLRLRPDAAYSLRVQVRCADGMLAPARIAGFTPSVTLLDVTLPRGLDVVGVVVRPDGTPVVGARVRVPPPETPWYPKDGDEVWTSLDGSFRLTGLEPGAVRLEIDSPGLHASPTVVAGDTSLRLVVSR